MPPAPSRAPWAACPSPTFIRSKSSQVLSEAAFSRRTSGERCRSVSWASFAEAEGDADLDYNLVYRWDWDAADESDPEDADTLKIYFMGQRKALCRSVDVTVTRADEEAVRAYLFPRWKKLQDLWAPLSEGRNGGSLGIPSRLDIPS